MRYPIIKHKKSYYPTKPVCPVCKKKNAFTPHMFILSGGACLMNKKRDSGSPDDRMDGFLCVSPHSVYDGKTNHKYKFKKSSFIEIAKDIQGGQFEFNFCSTKCLRKWLNTIVDDLEKRMVQIPKVRRKKTKNNTTSPRRPK